MTDSRLYMSYLIGLLCCLGFLSCEKTEYVPKPKAYPRIIFPERSYQQYRDSSCPYTFEYPSYATIEKDSFYFDQDISGNCWINIQLSDLQGTIYISYKEIEGDFSLQNILEDAHEMTYAHTEKADYIDELSVKNPYGVEGLVFEIGGNAASAVQFYVSDYKKHYLRGALYFNTHPNADSLAPVVSFVKTDIFHLLETFNWDS